MDFLFPHHLLGRPEIVGWCPVLHHHPSLHPETVWLMQLIPLTGIVAGLSTMQLIAVVFQFRMC